MGIIKCQNNVGQDLNLCLFVRDQNKIIINYYFYLDRLSDNFITLATTENIMYEILNFKCEGTFSPVVG